MSEDMNLSLNGQSKVPPGFRFHPTEEELLHYYLRKKVANQKIDLDVIRDVDLNKLEPWDIQEKCKIGSTPQDDWYFFSHKDKKYPTGTRTNRATEAGFWKATGRDKVIRNSLRRIGMRKTLVFYTGRAPHGHKSDWIMHEYRLDDDDNVDNGLNISGDSGQEEGWVVCRVFKKKSYHNKSLDDHSPNSSTSILCKNQLQRHHGGVLDQILTYMGQSSSPPPQEISNLTRNSDGISFQFSDQTSSGGFLHLPELESPNANPTPSAHGKTCDLKTSVNDVAVNGIGQSSRDWVELERLVASQLNGQPSKQLLLSSFGDHEESPFSFPLEHDDDELQFLYMERGKSDQAANVSSSETDFWNFGRESSSLSSSCSDPLGHLSV